MGHTIAFSETYKSHKRKSLLIEDYAMDVLNDNKVKKFCTKVCLYLFIMRLRTSFITFKLLGMFGFESL